MSKYKILLKTGERLYVCTDTLTPKQATASWEWR